MESTLLVGDFLLVNKVIYGSSTPRRIPFTATRIPSFRFPAIRMPKRGEIVVFEFPGNIRQDYVKRCVGTPGDTVQMRDKVLYVNNVPQDEPYVQFVDRYIHRSGNRTRYYDKFAWQYDYLAGRDTIPREEYKPTRDNFGPLVVPKDHFFFMGDNRDNSSDSRFWGFIDTDRLKGTPMIIYFSWNNRKNFPRLSRFGSIIE